MSFSYEFEADLNDPILKKDIQLTPEKLAFLEGNAEKCFLCKWMLEDYKKNGTFTGVKQSGDLGVNEIFPIRGEVNHLWLELHQKPYPFKKKVSLYEAAPVGYAPNMPSSTFVLPTAPANVPVAKPGVAPPAPPAQPTPPPEIVKDIESVPVAKPRKG